MADNIPINAPTSVGKTVASKDIGGIQHEQVINEFIDGGGNPVMVSATDPMPVTDAAAEASLLSIAAEDFATQATLAALLAKVIAAPSTEAKQDAMVVLLTTIAAITQPLTDAQLRATPVPVSGIIATGGLTDTQLRATPVPISGTVAITGGGDATAANQSTQITAEQAIQVAVQIMDDWDESDRAKVNLIVGQAGIAAGTGVDGVTVPRVTLATNVALPAGNNNIGDVDVASIAAGANLIGKVGIDQTTPGTTNAVAATGNVAHDAVDSGNPVKVGQKAISFGTNPTAVASGDRTDWYANIAGIPFMIAGHPNIVCFRATYTAAQTDTAIITIAGGLKIVVTRLTVTASAANTVNVSVIVGFGTANTPTTTGVVLSHPGLAPGSGVVEGNGAGILGVGADGADLRITSAVPTSGAIDVVVSYFTIES